jgi:ribosomal-protein-alanine N-acetyltransferase
MILPSQIEPQKSWPAPSQIQVRKMQLGDVPQVVEMENDYSTAPWTWRAIAFEVAENPLSVAFVAEFEGTVRAYLIGWRLDRESHVGTFCVERGFRRRGLGGFLLTNFINQMRADGVDRIHLEVRHSNLAAQQLYFKHGFEQVGLRKNYYSREKEDALLLSIYLQEEAKNGLV